MITWGISGNSHDAAIAVFQDKILVHAGHSERYSRIKNDSDLDLTQVNELKRLYGEPDSVIWYEKPWAKTFRQLQAGQGWLWRENNIKKYLEKFDIHAPISYQWHHRSHAAAGYYTSGFDNATVVVIDAIGEFQTLSFWQGQDDQLTELCSQSYPDSVGLWYSAMTDRIGLKPNEEEYILMGMAALGDPNRLSSDILRDFVEFSDVQDSGSLIKFKHNLHKGCTWWRRDLEEKDHFDIAAGTQAVYEIIFHKILQTAQRLGRSENLVLMGGCALNCVANPVAYKYFKKVWIMPNPGDAGSAVGAVLAGLRQHIAWPGPYLGTDMGYQHSNDDIVEHLLRDRICGLARGRAEYGPRALGNRSLIADPRGTEVKALLNSVKQRQEFRPFAPAVLAEHAREIFDMPCDHTPYMQFAVRCRKPELYPAIVHADGTSRVQTVTREDNPQFRDLLEKWYARTGCPLLVNTSLNIRGEPLINTDLDADRWEKLHNVRIFR